MMLGGQGSDGRGVSNVVDNGNYTFTFQMSDGSNLGPVAIPAGPAGPQGPTGEVSAADLSSAIATTSANSNGVALLNLTVSNPPTQAEVQALANKIDELITALRR